VEHEIVADTASAIPLVHHVILTPNAYSASLFEACHSTAA